MAHSDMHQASAPTLRSISAATASAGGKVRNFGGTAWQISYIRWQI